MIELFAYPFMQRALLAGLFSACLLGSLGVFVVSRNMSFIGDGLAHASLAGVALAILAGLSPLPVALCFAIFFACGIYLMEHTMKVSSDMAIGIVFTTGMALGIILMSVQTGYQPELISFLFGNILAVSNSDLVTTAIVGTAVLTILFFISKKLTFVTLDEEGAYLSGLNPQRYILLLYVLIAISIVLGIQLLGIILVSALLIIPSAISRLFARSFYTFQIGAFISAILVVFVGIVLSYYLDLPTGAVIILTGTSTFFLASVFHWFFK